MLKKKAVVKYQNGDIIKGWVEDFRPDRESFFLFPLIEYSEKERMEIKFSSLKAVFFIKEKLSHDTAISIAKTSAIKIELILAFLFILKIREVGF